jgi:hypothetical protein
MFKLLRLKLRLNFHITLKLHIQVRSSEMRLTEPLRLLLDAFIEGMLYGLSGLR